MPEAERAPASRPWLRFYGELPASLDYPETGLYETLRRSAAERSQAPALDFLGTTLRYGELVEQIDRCAAGLASLGLEAGDRLTISTPTCPQGLIAFYAAARLGAIASLIHPLSTAEEVAGYLTVSRSRIALTLDAFYDRFATARGRTPLETVVLARVPDYLPPLKRLGFRLTTGRAIPPVPAGAPVCWWSQLLEAAPAPVPPARVGADDPAAILYSGGTTGAPKGIVLSHRNLIGEAMQVACWVGLGPGDTVLAVLPIFHGFGLGALLNAPLLAGARAVMVPRYSPEAVAKLLRTARPTLIAGPPTLYDSLARGPALRRADLSSLRAAFCGADTLPGPVRERFERLVAERGGTARLLEGYGLTETVTAIMAVPLHEPRPGSIGIPFPDMLAAICEPGTVRELPAGEDGEICVCGPAVMLGYLDDPEATAAVLKPHPDGRLWLHTGDLGSMDGDGFFSFRSRLKRMVKTSGYSVYPAQVESVLYGHPAVAEACVIGVPDKTRGARLKAFVVAHEPHEPRDGDELAAQLVAYCREHLIAWSCPREVELRRELPKTRLGKIDYRALEEEELGDAAAPGEPPGEDRG